MNKQLSRVYIACAAIMIVAGCAASSSVAPSASNLATGFTPRSDSATGFLFPYVNGAVLVKPKMYLIFWGYKSAGDPDKVAPLLEDYAAAIGGSRHDAIYTQYYQIVRSKMQYITNPKNQLGGVWFDDSTIPQYPTDAQVAAEAIKGATQLGYDADGSYVVATAHGHNSQGFGSQWCSYHSNTYSGSNLLSYTNLPYMPDAGDSCGADAIAPPKDESAKDEGVTIGLGIDYGESITDPNPGTAWYSLEYGEISGPCGGAGVENDKFGKKSYTTATMYSNASESCVQTYGR